jgi:hypothetical protein
MACARRPSPRTLTSVDTTATFRLAGDATLTAAAVTRRLGIQPSHAFEPGDPASSRSANTRDSSLWLLSSSSGIETATEVTDRQTLQRLLALPGDLWLDVCGEDTDQIG